jgi:hypothetical protein
MTPALIRRGFLFASLVDDFVTPRRDEKTKSHEERRRSRGSPAYSTAAR